MWCKESLVLMMLSCMWCKENLVLVMLSCIWCELIGVYIVGYWMCYDDLRSQYAQFSAEKFSVPPSNIHIVFWEALQQPANNSLRGAVDSRNPTCRKAPSNTSTNVNSIVNKYASVSENTSSVTGKDLVSTQQSVNSVQPTPHVTNSGNNTDGRVTAAPLPNLSKSLTIGKAKTKTNSPSQTKSGVERKPVALLKGKIGSKRSLSDSIRLPTVINPTNSQSSYQEVMSSLLLTPDNSTVKVTPKVSKVSPKNSSATKSYMDLVKPLLQKNKEQKGKVLGGYVPKAKRDDDAKPTSSKQKKVMFTGVASPASTPKLSKNGILSVPHDVRATPTPRKHTNTKKASALLDNFVPYTPKKAQSPEITNDTQQLTANDDMPSLEDMLGGFV